MSFGENMNINNMKIEYKERYYLTVGSYKGTIGGPIHIWRFKTRGRSFKFSVNDSNGKMWDGKFRMLNGNFRNSKGSSFCKNNSLSFRLALTTSEQIIRNLGGL